MTIGQIYDNVGPFKDVPEQDRKRLARTAGEAVEVAYGTALRQARDAGDAEVSTACFSSVSAVNSGWSMIQRHNENEVTGYRCGIWIFRAFSVFLAAFLSCMAHEVTKAVGEVYPEVNSTLWFSVAMVAIALAFSIGNYAVTRLEGETYRAIRKHGYDDWAAQSFAIKAGKCWIIGNEALHIAEIEGGKSVARSVFFDAIGHVSAKVVENRETVVLMSRDGDRIAALQPGIVLTGGDQTETIGEISAEDLATSIRERAAASRATAKAG